MASVPLDSSIRPDGPRYKSMREYSKLSVETVASRLGIPAAVILAAEESRWCGKTLLARLESFYITLGEGDASS